MGQGIGRGIAEIYPAVEHAEKSLGGLDIMVNTACGSIQTIAATNTRMKASPADKLNACSDSANRAGKSSGEIADQ
ncbi:MAG: hypothetical protein ACI9XK_003959 [Granulosicoccus sp.]